MEPSPEEVENQRHFNELRGELLNAREKVVDRWLTTVAVMLTVFSLVAALVGYLSFDGISEVRAEVRRQEAEVYQRATQVHRQAAQVETLVKQITTRAEESEGWDKVDGRELPQESREVTDTDTKPRAERELPQESREVTDTDTKSRAVFGEWKRRQHNFVYQASTDGFIAAYTGGNTPAQGFMIYTGKTQDSMPLRTRGGRYDGAVCPVAKGSFWTVQADGEGSLTVQWLPVGSSQS